MIRGKDIIYVNGDSFTQGCDLEDHLYPGLKKNYSLNELLSIPFQQVIDHQRISIQEKEVFANSNAEENSKFLDLQRTLRWSSALQDILNKPVFNLSSHGGSSMYAIAYRTMADIVALKDQGYNITDIIIQITSSGRFSIFKNTEDWEEPPRPTRRYNITSANIHSTKYQIDQLLIHETLEFNDYRVLHDLFTLKYALTSLTNARIIFVDSVFYKKTLSKYDCFTFKDCNLPQNDHVVQFKKQLDQDIKLSMLECVEPSEPDTITTSLHFTAKVHRRFAELIAETYFNE
jgi:hypothetical protein